MLWREGGRDRESVHCSVTALLLLLLRASLGDRDRDRLAGWLAAKCNVCVSVLHDDQLGDCGDKWIVAQADHRNVHSVSVSAHCLSYSDSSSSSSSLSALLLLFSAC